MKFAQPEFTIFIEIKQIEFLEGFMSIVEVRDIVKEYPSFRLEKVSFNVDEGKITGFIGRNGAGKTTTIKSMLNLIHTDGGEVDYFGKPLQGNETDV